MKRFKLSDEQAEAVLELKLRHLAKLEEIKIKSEQDALNKERDTLEKTLQSATKLKNLIRKEILEDAEKYGDERRSSLIVRGDAQAIREEEMLPSEAMTIVLSQKGWVRAAKGHDIDAAALSYKSSDSLKMTAEGRSNQYATFLDSAGRSYSIMPHSFPSARSQGEPLTSRLKPQPGATFTGVLAGDPKQLYLLASDAGYGFVTTLEELTCKNKSGKAVVKAPKGALVLNPKRVTHYEDQFIAAVTSVGRMLIFPLADLPQLARGKGNKIIGIPSAKVASREEFVIDLAILNENSTLTLHSGKRSLTLKPKDLANFHGERGRRGNMLPRGFRNVDHMHKDEN